MTNDNNNIQLTSDLQQAVGYIKQAIQRSQARALRSVNNEVLSLYYAIGQYVSENSRHNMWGKGAIKSISQQLQKEIPGLTGFSASSIRNMRQFYEEWSEIVNCQPAAGELPVDENQLLSRCTKQMTCEV